MFGLPQCDKLNVNLDHTVQFIPYGVIFYAHNTNESDHTDSPTMHPAKLSEKGWSKPLSQFPISRGT